MPIIIVMGTHGHGAMYNLLVGSATKGVLKHSTRPCAPSSSSSLLAAELPNIVAEVADLGLLETLSRTEPPRQRSQLQRHSTSMQSTL
jgi:hypothetical protein